MFKYTYFPPVIFLPLPPQLLSLSWLLLLFSLLLLFTILLLFSLLPFSLGPLCLPVDINAQARKVQRNRAKGTLTLPRSSNSSFCRSLSETSLNQVELPAEV